MPWVSGILSGGARGGATIILAILAFAGLWFILGGIACVVGGFLPNISKEACAFNLASGMVQFGGLILTWMVGLFDFTLTRGVLRAGEWLREGGAFGIGIATVWTVLRDLVNLAFIGGLVWASISMILRTGQQIGKLVIQLLIAALLVNFSYFFAGAILDASHYSARIVYTQALGGDAANVGEGSGQGTYAGIDIKSGEIIAARFMHAAKLGSIYELDQWNQENSALRNTQDHLIIGMVGFFGLVLLLTAAWIFGAFGAHLLRRFVIVVMLLMTAPVAVLAFTDIPKLKDVGKWWWGILYSQALFPPVFLLLLASALTVMEKASTEVVGEGTTFLGLFSGPEVGSGFVTGAFAEGPWGAAWELIIVYLVGIALMFMALRVSNGIAEQRDFKLPKAGEIYGAMSAKAVTKTFQGIANSAPAKAIGFAARPVSNIVTQPLKGIAPITRTGAVEKAVGERYKTEWEEAESAYALARVRHAKGEISDKEKDDALDAAAIAFGRLSEEKQKSLEGEKRTTNDKDDDSVTNTDKQEAFIDIVAHQDDLEGARKRQEALKDTTQQNSDSTDSTGTDATEDPGVAEDERMAESGSGGTEEAPGVAKAEEVVRDSAPTDEAGGTTQKPDGASSFSAASEQQFNKLVAEIKTLDQDQARRSIKENRLALMDMISEKSIAHKVIGAFRAVGSGGESLVGSLPIEVLKEPEVAATLQLTDINELSRELSKEDFKDVMVNVTEEVREQAKGSGVVVNQQPEYVQSQIPPNIPGATTPTPPADTGGDENPSDEDDKT